MIKTFSRKLLPYASFVAGVSLGAIGGVSPDSPEDRTILVDVVAPMPEAAQEFLSDIPWVSASCIHNKGSIDGALATQCRLTKEKGSDVVVLPLGTLTADGVGESWDSVQCAPQEGTLDGVPVVHILCVYRGIPKSLSSLADLPSGDVKVE